MLEELRAQNDHTIILLCEDNAAISIAKYHVHHDRTKHMEINPRFIKEKTNDRTIKLVHIPSSHQTAYI